MRDDTVLTALRNGDLAALDSVYIEHREEFLAWITRTYGCTMEDAKDIYQVSTLLLYENAVSGKLVSFSGTLKTYLFAIGKNKAREWARQKQRFVQEQLMEPEAEGAVDDDKETLFRMVEHGLEQLGDPCRELLKLFYFQKKSVEEITAALKYKNRDTTKNLKYKCLNRLRKICKAT